MGGTGESRGFGRGETVRCDQGGVGRGRQQGAGEGTSRGLQVRQGGIIIRTMNCDVTISASSAVRVSRLLPAVLAGNCFFVACIQPGVFACTQPRVFVRRLCLVSGTSAQVVVWCVLYRTYKA